MNSEPESDKLSAFIHDGRERRYLLHIPPSYSDLVPTPLVVVLHAWGGNAKLMELMTGFSKKADEEGFLALYPEGTHHVKGGLTSWNTGFCCGFAREEGIDDVGFISSLIHHLEARFNIDVGRIFVTGMSNGAMMAYRLGAELSDKIAAIGAVGGAIGGRASKDQPFYIIPKPKRPVSVIIFHGLDDDLVPYYGGRPGAQTSEREIGFTSVEEAVDFWRQSDGCEFEPIEVGSPDENLIERTYTSCDQANEVILYTLAGGGHSWPGGKVHLSGREPSEKISATDLIWEFFKHHPRN